MSSGRQFIPPLLPLLLSLSRAAPPPATTPTTTTSTTTTTTTPRPFLSWQSLPPRPLQLLQSLQNLQNLPQLPLTIHHYENPRPLQTLQAALQNAVNTGTRQRRSADTFPPTQSPRQEKALQYFQYDFPEAVPNGYLAISADDPAAAAAAAAGELVAVDINGELLEGATDANGNELVSRANPPYRKQGGNSPIYYIRLPPSPYVFVPGIGYVSQPTNSQQPAAPRPPSPSPFINLPLTFVSNGKPTGVFQPAWAPQRPVRPPPPPPRPSSIFNLDKGPYLFNGRPTDLFVLRNTYDELYADALQNLYP